MPDPWEYPWFAAWDLAFHAITLAHVDPAFAKYQLLLMCREWFQHPSGALPAYEWNFDDVNPPVHALAALMVWDIDGRRDLRFLERVFHKLLLNFTWWLNRQDAAGRDLFSGGFLGLDNLSAFDRSHLPVAGVLEQSDATAWMYAYCLSMLRMANELAAHDAAYRDLMTTFLEHAVRIAAAINRQGLWDDTDAFYYDALLMPDGTRVPLRIRSMIGILPVLPGASVPRSAAQLGAMLGKHFARSLATAGVTDETFRMRGSLVDAPGHDALVLSLLPPVHLERVLANVLSEDTFLSPHGLRALSREHLERPFRIAVEGVEASVDYEPGESTNDLFGGNSNWRGPVWFPVNYLFLESMFRWDAAMGDGFTVEYPTGSGRRMRLRDVAQDLARRLVSIWLPDADGLRPVSATMSRFRDDPEWRDLLWFHEYFHGDTGAGLGASHQTGWTGLVAHLLCRGGLLDAAPPGPPEAPKLTDAAAGPGAKGRTSGLAGSQGSVSRNSMTSARLVGHVPRGRPLAGGAHARSRRHLFDQSGDWHGTWRGGPARDRPVGRSSWKRATPAPGRRSPPSARRPRSSAPAPGRVRRLARGARARRPRHPVAVRRRCGSRAAPGDWVARSGRPSSDGQGRVAAPLCAGGRVGRHRGLGFGGCRIGVVPPVDPWGVAAVQDLGSAVLAEVVPAPLHEGIHAVADARHEHGMDAQPCGEGDRAMELVVADGQRRHGGVAVDHRHRALVQIVEGPRRLALDLAHDVVAGPRAALHRDRAQLRVGAAVRAGDVGDVAHHVHAREPVHREVGLHVDPAPRLVGRPDADASGAACRPPPRITQRVLIRVPSDSTTWPGPTSVTPAPRCSRTLSRWRTRAA
ncbi:MAG: hypothetical protein R3C32_09910 [Chloroflexota bacterium]